MFTTDATIDAVQTAKKTFVNIFVTNDTIKNSMIKFIDSQAEYTKKAAKVGLDTSTEVVKEAIKVVQKAAEFDYIKYFDAYYDSFSKAFAVAKK
jgi:N-acetylmuramic acid 6-phosphate (MurNAc-6-P) etherase